MVAVLAAGTVAGAVNAVVGAGTLVTFSTLVALGVSPLTANVSNTVGLVAGSVASSVGYRVELRTQRHRMLRLAPAALGGGITGAVLLLLLPSSAFDAIVPILVLAGVLLVLIGPRVASRLATPHDILGHGGVGLLVGVFATGVYGGYFGAAQGVLLIALMGSLLDQDLQRVNALKNFLAALVNAVAAVIFVFAAPVDWTIVGLLVVGSTIGGFVGAHFGRRLPQAPLRWFIVTIGVVAVVVLVTG
ncbi:MAG TPA: sulfite exporter TauE/SafE family protein [Actinomycetes bacterium]|nr:sulfite exporter TauE/SafE family protein [Actinomycetes bacterium]